MQPQKLSWLLNRAQNYIRHLDDVKNSFQRSQLSGVVAEYLSIRDDGATFWSCDARFLTLSTSMGHAAPRWGHLYIQDVFVGREGNVAYNYSANSLLHSQCLRTAPCAPFPLLFIIVHFIFRLRFIPAASIDLLLLESRSNQLYNVVVRAPWQRNEQAASGLAAGLWLQH